MKTKRSRMIGGIALVIIGIFYLLENVGLIPDLAPVVWGVLFAGISLASLGAYLSSGWREWGWLFPIFIPAGLAAAMFMAAAEGDGLWIGALFLAATALPFWLLFLIDRRQWWALIPGWVLAVLTAVTLLAETASGEVIGAMVMVGTGLPFVVVYLVNRKQWWALIPAFILVGIGVALLGLLRSPEWMGMLILFIIALPFYVVFFRSPQQWWAIIPAGIMTTLGIVGSLSLLIAVETWGARLIAAVFFAGSALPFVFLWWRHERYATDWAKYPAAGLLSMGVLALIFGAMLDWLWAVLFIGLGGWLLLRSVREPKLKG